MNWNDVNNIVKKHAESMGGLFVKLANNGDKVIGAFVGDPYPRTSHWVNNSQQECSGDKECKHCKAGVRATLRISLNFYVPSEEKGKRMKIVQGGIKWFETLSRLRAKYDFADWLFEIERVGEANDPKTTYAILPEVKLTDEQRKELETLKLHGLEALKLHGLAPPAGSSSTGDKDSFSSYEKKKKSDAIAGQLVTRLKQLPRTAVDSFCEKFEVKRVRDLKPAQAQKAQTFVDALEAEHNRNDENSEVDPFE